MKKPFFLIVIAVLLVFGVYAVVTNSFVAETETEDKVLVVTTLFPMYDFAREIGGDKVNVTLLLPPGVEAHSFEPKPSDIVKIGGADVFVYTGEFMEPWAHDVIEAVKNDKVRVVDVSTGINLMDEEDDHEDDDDYEGYDPHIWLDFENAKIMVDNIASALVEVDSSNADFYLDNAKKYNDRLTLLDDSYKKALSSCQSNKIVYGGHYTFGYMAKRYGLEYNAAQGFSPDSEPTAKDMIALIEQIKGYDIGYVFYEELSSPKIAQTLADETGTQMLLLNGAHNLSKDDYENNVTYIDLMEYNLVNLVLGLNCAN